MHAFDLRVWGPNFKSAHSGEDFKFLLGKGQVIPCWA